MKYLTILFAALLFIACGGGGSESAANEETAPVEETAPKINAAKMAQGGAVYKQYCIACHMENGQGAAGLNPPLVDTKYVLGDKEALILIALNGFNGEELEVKGEIYNGIMTPHDFLSDAELANVLTYVRNSWGNEASEVTIEEVAEARAKNDGA
ncbi:MAG: cytochrome c [Bacteroidota bacterium]